MKKPIKKTPPPAKVKPVSSGNKKLDNAVKNALKKKPK